MFYVQGCILGLSVWKHARDSGNKCFEQAINQSSCIISETTKGNSAIKKTIFESRHIEKDLLICIEFIIMLSKKQYNTNTGEH